VADTNPTILIDDEVWPTLRRLAARRRRGAAIVAVPYVTEPLLELRAGDTLAVDLSPATLATGQTKPAVLRRYLKAGVHLHSSPGLHAKLFVLGNVAVVGSANMSASSAETLREAVVIVANKAAVRAAAEAAAQLLGPEIGKAELDAADKLYRPAKRGGTTAPKRPSKQHPAGPPPGPDDRLWVIGLYGADWPATAVARAEAARRGLRRRAGPAADVEIGSGLFDIDKAPKLRIDDIVIEVFAYSRKKPLVVAEAPARVIELLEVPGRGRSKGWVIAYWRRPKGTATLDWEDVQAAAKKAGAHFTDDATFMRHVTKPALHAALRRLWKYPPAG
jgi:hypothetical protein